MPAKCPQRDSPPRPLSEYSSEGDSFATADDSPSLRPCFTPEQRERTLSVWESYYAAMLYSLHYTDGAQFDDAMIKKMNLAGRDHVLHWKHRPPTLVPVFVGNLYTASVHSNLAPLWHLLRYLTNNTWEGRLVLTLLGKGNTGATLWTDAATAALLLNHGNCRLQVAPRGFYLATDDLQRQVLWDADHSDAKPHAAGFPVRSMTFAPSEVGTGCFKSSSNSKNPKYKKALLPLPVCP